MGIDRERWNLLAFSQPKMPPGFARVGGLVNSVADGKIRALQSFTTGDIHDIRIRRSNRNRADGLGWLSIKNRVPGAAIVVGLPDAAIHRAYIEHVRLARHACKCTRPTATKGSDHAPAHLLKHVLGNLLGIENTEVERDARHE